MTAIVDLLIRGKYEAGQAFKAAHAGIDGLTNAAAKANLGMADLQAGLGMVTSMLGTIQQAYTATVGVVLDYATQVRTLSTTIGASAEESSMLIQAADDMGVSYQTLTRSLETAIKKGVEPSIEGIGVLADRYNAIQNPIERTRFLMESFGTSGADLAMLMQQGSAGIREMGRAAQEAGLVLDQQAVQAARNYEMALDDLLDRANAVAIKTGNDLIPVLSDALTAVEHLTSGTEKAIAAYQAHDAEVAKNAKSYFEYGMEMNRTAQELKAYVFLMDGMAGLQELEAKTVQQATKAHYEQAQALAAAAAAYKETAAAAQNLNNVVATGATSGIGNAGYMGYSSERGANPTRKNQTYGFLTGRASGGPMVAGEVYIAGERGPEPIMLGTSGRAVPGGDTSGGGGGNLTIPVTVSSLFPPTSSAQVTQAVEPAIREVIRRLKADGTLR